MIKQFINRDVELTFLETHIIEPKPQLLIFYGRRRVGKTELLVRFIKSRPDIPSIYFLAGRKRWDDNIHELQLKMSEVIGDTLFSSVEFNDYFELFKEFSNRFSGQIIIIIDEFPYLHDPKKDIESIFQKIYDEVISNSEIYLILCGSSVSMMESLLGYKSPLYGRRTGQWLVEPLRFKDACKFFARYDMLNCIRSYAILGGIPFYLSMFNDNITLMENIKRTLLNKGSILYKEPEFLLIEEVREPRNYFLILKAISSGKTRFSEIMNVTGLDKSIISRYIDILHDLRIIRKSAPVTLKKQNIRDMRYYLEDNLFKFWFKFIYPNEALIEYGQIDTVIQSIKSQLDTYIGPIFEDIAQQFIFENMDEFPFRFEKIGKWWHKANEIDLVAFNEVSRKIIFIECKWQNRKIGVDVLSKLMDKAKYVDWKNETREDYFCIISKNGLTTNAVRFAMDNEIISFNIEDIERIQKKEFKGI
ncbi:MAG: ATP-binding protein [Euryarchaeota archaeon]|nr:ATP-binding protein [Euryarchaeota archaeon]